MGASEPSWDHGGRETGGQPRRGGRWVPSRETNLAGHGGADTRALAENPGPGCNRGPLWEFPALQRVVSGAVNTRRCAAARGVGNSSPPRP